MYRAGGVVAWPAGRSSLAASSWPVQRPHQPLLGVVPLGCLVVGALHVGTQEPGEGDRLAGGGELRMLPIRAVTSQSHRHTGTHRVGHLGRDGALPDQLVEPELLPRQLAGHLAGRAEAVPGRTNRLVRLLGVLDLADIASRLGRHILVAVQRTGLRPSCRQRGFRQVRGVRPHIGDIAVLIQPLRDPHRLLTGQPQFPTGLLLQRAGDERRVGAPTVRLLLDPHHLEPDAVQSVGQTPRRGLVQVDDITRRPHGRRHVLRLGLRLGQFPG